MPLKIITTVSAYIKLLELTPVPNWVKWTKVGSNLGQIQPEHNWAKIVPNLIRVPMVIVKSCLFGSRYRSDWYDTSHSAYVATETELVGAKIDGLLPPNFL